MKITIKNDDQSRVAAIQNWENDTLQSVDQLLPSEEKSVYIYSTKYVTIIETGNEAKAK
jgi:hypothetical protein